MERLTSLKKVKRARKHGFLSRMDSYSGQKVIRNRRNNKRTRLTV